MSYTLNTSHPLYANLIDLIGVQGGALVSHKTALTFTKHASATYGSGTWGEHFKTGPKGWYLSGATFTPDLTYDTSGGKGFTIFYAVNNIETAADSLGALQQSTVSYGVSAAGQRAVSGNSSPDPYRSLTTVGVGSKSICVTRNGETSNKSYIDGILEYTGGRLDWNNPADSFNSIGGFDGQGVAGGIEFVWVAAFDKVLSDAEVLALHNSLGASNTFGLVSSGSNSSLLLDAGVYSITGVSLTLDGAVTYTLPLDTGAYNVSSVAATFGVSFPLDAGIYNLNGNAVTLTQSTISSSTYSLLLGDGVYTITGMDVLTPVSTKLLIESGVYTVLGRNVLLQSSTEPIIVSSGGHTISVSIKIGI